MTKNKNCSKIYSKNLNSKTNNSVNNETIKLYNTKYFLYKNIQINE